MKIAGRNLSLARAFFVVAIVFAGSCFLIPQAHAQEDGRAITVIPPKFELFSNPGDAVTEQIRIRNESAFPASYGIVVEDFSAAGEEGQVVLEEEGNANFSLASWIEPETKDIVLQPGEERSFSFTIRIPRGAEPGGHYASLLFSSAGDEVPGAASVTQRIGSLLLLRVSGNVQENAIVETFEAPSYSKSGPVPFTLRVKNDGNVHVRPVGTIIIKNLFNQKVDEIPLNGANVIPGAIRKMDTVWEKENLLGSYTATMVATYGDQNIPLTAATRFTVASPTAVIIIVVAIVALIVFIISLISGRKRVGKAFKALSGD